MKKLILIILPLILLLAGCGGEALKETAAEGGERYYSVGQGFNFLASRQAPVGHITYLKIGSLEIAADLAVTDPMNPTSRINAVGVVSWLIWRGEAKDSIVFAAQVSAQNKETLAALGKSDLTDIEIAFGLALYDYDSGYYRSLSSNGKILKGTLHKEGEHLLYYISTDAGAEVTTPENYNFQLGVKPLETRQEIQVGDGIEGWGSK